MTNIVFVGTLTVFKRSKNISNPFCGSTRFLHALRLVEMTERLSFLSLCPSPQAPAKALACNEIRINASEIHFADEILLTQEEIFATAKVKGGEASAGKLNIHPPHNRPQIIHRTPTTHTRITHFRHFDQRGEISVAPTLKSYPHKKPQDILLPFMRLPRRFTPRNDEYRGSGYFNFFQEDKNISLIINHT